MKRETTANSISKKILIFCNVDNDLIEFILYY